MDYIPLQSGAEQLQLALWLFAAGALFGALMAILLLFKADDSKAKRIVFGTGTVLGFGALIGSLLLMVSDLPSDRGWKPWRAELTAAVAENYGLTPTGAQLLELNYPSEQPEALIPSDYGSTTLQIPAEAGGGERRVTLRWDGAQMVLTAPDSAGVLQPIPPLAPQS